MSLGPQQKGERDRLQYDLEYKRIRRHLDSDSLEEASDYISLLRDKVSEGNSTQDQLVLDVLTFIIQNKANKIQENLQLIPKLEGTITNKLMFTDFVIAKADTLWKAGKPLDALSSLEIIENEISTFKSDLISKPELNVIDIAEREVDIQNIKGTICWYLGDVGKAHVSFNQALNLIVKSKLPNQIFLATTLNNLGNITSYKGDLFIALGHHLHSLEIRQKFHNKTDIACSYGNIAEIYQYMGKYDLALDYYKRAQELFETLDNHLYLPQLYHDLINVYLIFEDLQKSQFYLDRLKDLDSKYGKVDPIIHTYFLLSEGLMLKNSTSLMKKFKAADNFLQIANGPVIDSSLTAQAIFNLSDILLLEMRLTQSEENLDDIKARLTYLFSLAEDQTSPLLLVQCLLLDSKLKLLEFNVEEAKTALSKALKIANNIGLKKFESLIPDELNHLLRQEKTWENLRLTGATIDKRIEFAGLDRTLDNIIRRRHNQADLLDLIKQAIEPTVKQLKPWEKSNEQILDVFYNIMSSETYITIYRQFKLGPEIYLSDDLRFSKTDKILLETKLGVFFITSVGQGDNSNEGLFGPLPFPDSPEYESIIYSCFMNDPENKDPRANGQSYCLFVLTFPKTFEPYYSNRQFLTKTFDDFQTQFNKLQDIQKSNLEDLKLQLIT